MQDEICKDNRKLRPSMKDWEHTMIQLEKLNRLKSYLKSNGVLDRDSFIEISNEE